MWDILRSYDLPDTKLWNVVVTTRIPCTGGTRDFQTIKNWLPLSWENAVRGIQGIMTDIAQGKGNTVDAELRCSGLRRPWTRETYLAYRNMVKEKEASRGRSVHDDSGDIYCHFAE